MAITRRATLQIVGIALAAASLAAVGWFAYTGLKSGISLADAKLLPFFVAILVQLLVLVLSSLLWERVLDVFCVPGGLSRNIGDDRFALHKAFTRSWLARYVPGRIWMFGGRVLLASKLGVPVDSLVSSMFFEFLFSYSMLTLVGAMLIASLLLHPIVGLSVLLIGSASVVVGVLAIQRVVAQRTQASSDKLSQRFRNFLGRMLVSNNRATTRQVVWGVVAYGVHASLQLVFIVLVAESLLDISISQALAIAGVWALSGVLGYLAFFSSAGGLGVRDGLALAFLSHFLDPSSAALVIATARAIMIPADVAFVGGIELMSRANTFKNRLVTEH